MLGRGDEASISVATSERPFSFDGDGAAFAVWHTSPEAIYQSLKRRRERLQKRLREVEIADEIVAVLRSDPNASVRVVVEISAEFPGGVTETGKRAVSENARTLGLKSADWE